MITSVLEKILNHIKFETSPILTKFLKENYLNFIYNYEEIFGWELEFNATWSENALFSKN